MKAAIGAFIFSIIVTLAIIGLLIFISMIVMYLLDDDEDDVTED